MAHQQLQMFGGDWTEQKLDILSNYLRQYNVALKNQRFLRIYVDAFAGTGYREGVNSDLATVDLFQEIGQDDTQRFLKGSARRALEIEPGFDRYYFIESDPDKVHELRNTVQEHPDRTCHVQQDDANTWLQGFCAKMGGSTRAVVFLDPFATQVNWDTIQAIAATRRIDVWILFPLMAVNRLVANDPEKSCRQALDRVFGTTTWFDEFYQSRTENDIFGNTTEKVERACDTDGISRFYQRRLGEIFVGVSQKRRIFLNSRNSPLFQLFFAVANEKGKRPALRIADYLLEKL